MRRWITTLAVAAGAAVSGLIAPTTAHAAPYCGIYWGSLEKSAGTTSTPRWPIEDVRAGRHACFDRLVLDFAGHPSAYRVRYVPAVTQQGSGAVLPLRGGSYLQVEVLSTIYDVTTGSPTYRPANPDELVDVTGWRTFRQVALGGSFEGHTTIGLRVRARLPLRVFTLEAPGRPRDRRGPPLVSQGPGGSHPSG